MFFITEVNKISGHEIVLEAAYESYDECQHDLYELQTEQPYFDFAIVEGTYS